eukprot:6170-Heterococcus_DN1.PRE.3
MKQHMRIAVLARRACNVQQCIEFLSSKLPLRVSHGEPGRVLHTVTLKLCEQLAPAHIRQWIRGRPCNGAELGCMQAAGSIESIRRSIASMQRGRPGIGQHGA